MKKLLLLLIVPILVNADYTLFKSQTKEIGTVIKTEQIFFGVYTDFGKKLSSATDDGLKKALIAGIVGGLSTAGLGLVSGMLNNLALNTQMDEKYLQVLKIEDKEGNVAFNKTMFIGSNDSDYNDDEVLKIINSAKNKDLKEVIIDGK
jgi:hypothetical protein